jgi:cytoskeletal protein CcmA (bactofilin family)
VRLIDTQYGWGVVDAQSVHRGELIRIVMELSANLVVNGEISSTEDLVLQGHVDGGPVWSEGMAITVGQTASVTGDIIARDITVLGTVSGTLVATDVVDIRPSATVTGRVVSPRLILEEGAQFNGAVEPHRLDAALRVARHRRTNPPVAQLDSAV